MAARRISERVWLVGTSSDGPAHTDQYDCNQYLVWDGSSGVLVDSGCGRGTDEWLRNVSQVADPASLSGVLITHYHADHAGGAAAARSAGLPVFASPLSADAITRGDEDVTQVARARDAGVYPRDFSVSPAAGIDVLLTGRYTFGSIAVQVLDAPGHCDGHLVFGVEAGDALDLFTGDTIFPGGKVSIQAIPDCRLDAYGATIARLAALPVAALYPGHGEPDLDRASVADALTAAAASFARLVPPPNLLS